jgi:hypothetical protein
VLDVNSGGGEGLTGQAFRRTKLRKDEGEEWAQSGETEEGETRETEG